MSGHDRVKDLQAFQAFLQEVRNSREDFGLPCIQWLLAKKGVEVLPHYDHAPPSKALKLVWMMKQAAQSFWDQLTAGCHNIWVNLFDLNKPQIIDEIFKLEFVEKC